MRSKWKLINLQVVGKKNGQEKSNNNLVLAMQPQLIILEVIFHTRRKTQGRKGLSNGFGLVHYQSLYANFYCWKPLAKVNGFALKPLCDVSNWKQIVKKVIPNLVVKTMENVMCQNTVKGATKGIRCQFLS